ncbi:helix-turn-helix domain-containing protein [Desertihabitans brevis]|uniref:Helix-turn-helix domain-containing protein n=1 Tax=Desertihabitans brevis TaxID=2268447 RepID=A0A367YTK9_9ACTN|nr:excisionase family DNA-binding protein [Desertihabitans brevis]RCK68311.1 helix-turn-helix domain-containing protein [Desertihabitans brevis]
MITADLTTVEVAVQLRTDRWTVTKLIHRGELPGAYRLGAHAKRAGRGHWRIPQTAVDIYRRNHRHEAA